MRYVLNPVHDLAYDKGKVVACLKGNHAPDFCVFCPKRSEDAKLLTDTVSGNFRQIVEMLLFL